MGHARTWSLKWVTCLLLSQPVLGIFTRKKFGGIADCLNNDAINNGVCEQWEALKVVQLI